MILDNWSFVVEMGCGLDVFRLAGERGGKLILPSCPVSFNEQTMTITTKSGSVYELGCCYGLLEKQIELLRECVKRGGYQIL